MERNTWETHFRAVPFAILTVSICQILFYVFSTPSVKQFLRHDPSNPLEVWRYLTYMLVHEDWFHLLLNLVVQCIFAALLEDRQGRIRVLILYVLGGVIGSLGAAWLRSALLVGASAGGYSLLLTSFVDLLRNRHTINHRKVRSIFTPTVIITDMIYHVYMRETQVSWQAHLFGALTGLVLDHLNRVVGQNVHEKV
ncbi:hypothetical protein D910_05404 [Dendroctonus ponderosae]|uniref:Peptidase S54 rhomboid domain-containing protein n=1 Tax=Dendroctonus ponderosae TaxID=77166 RepID=U4UDL6_DENPD|nr:hypothetical protein D910_05404 [Dendroctonus ponderosae]